MSILIIFIFVVIVVFVIIPMIDNRFGGMSEEERQFAEQAYKLKNKGVDAKRSRTAKEALDTYEFYYSDISSRRELRSDHIYQEDMRDIRENYETLCREEWQAKADKILDKFYELFAMITNPDFKDVTKAYASKKRCIKYWQDYFYSIPGETDVWYDAKTHMKEYLGEDYDDCMYSHDTLEKKLSQCIEEMKPEYQRKVSLQRQILDVVGEQESIMRSKLISMPFEGCTEKEVQLCIKELVEAYKLVSLKTGNRYYVSLSDKEKEKRNRAVAHK